MIINDIENPNKNEEIDMKERESREKNLIEDSEIDKKSKEIGEEEDAQDDKEENIEEANEEIQQQNGKFGFDNNENKYKIKNEMDELKLADIMVDSKKFNFANDDNNSNYNKNDLDSEQLEKFKIPPELKKTFIVSLILALVGIALIIIGFINVISKSTPGGGIMFWILGGIVLIPGGFYWYQFYKAKKAKNKYARQDILDAIPQL